MKRPMTIYIGKRHHDWCIAQIEDGYWTNISDIVNYSLRIYLETIERDGIRSLPKLPRDELVRLSIRINEVPFNGLYDTGFFEKREIVDYALEFYINWRTAPCGA